MTPLLKHHDPDERPSTGEVVVAALLFVMVLAMLFVVDLLKGVTP